MTATAGFRAACWTVPLNRPTAEVSITDSNGAQSQIPTAGIANLIILFTETVSSCGGGGSEKEISDAATEGQREHVLFKLIPTADGEEKAFDCSTKSNKHKNYLRNYLKNKFYKIPKINTIKTFKCYSNHHMYNT